jgi:hypothetical protein
VPSLPVQPMGTREVRQADDDMANEDTANEVAANEQDEVRFTLRAPRYLFSKIDEFRGARVGKVSRNTWILEAITEKLQRERRG